MAKVGIALAAFVTGLIVGTTWAVVLDYFDPDGDYAAAGARRADR